MSSIPVVPSVLLLTAWLSVSAASPGAARGQVAADPASDDVVVVHAGDRVTLDFFSPPGEPVAVTTVVRIVDQDGSVFLPYVGSVSVAGLTPAQIEARLAELYTRFFTEPVVAITVELHVDITGTVRNPGTYYVRPSTTLANAVSQAGGVGVERFAPGNQIPSDPGRVHLVRDGVVRILDMRAGSASDTVLAMEVRSGDWIFVPPRSRLREEVQFWGGVLSILSSVAAVAVLLTR